MWRSRRGAVAGSSQPQMEVASAASACRSWRNESRRCVRAQSSKCSRALFVSSDITEGFSSPPHTGCVCTEAGTPASCQPTSQLAFLARRQRPGVPSLPFPCGDHVCLFARKSVDTFYKWEGTHVKRVRVLPGTHVRFLHSQWVFIGRNLLCVSLHAGGRGVGRSHRSHGSTSTASSCLHE